MNNDASLLARSVFFAFLAAGALLLAWLHPDRSRAKRALLPVAGALTYLAVSLFVLPAADARYNFWVNLVFITTFCCVLPGLSGRKDPTVRNVEPLLRPDRDPAKQVDSTMTLRGRQSPE